MEIIESPMNTHVSRIAIVQLFQRIMFFLDFIIEIRIVILANLVVTLTIPSCFQLPLSSSSSKRPFVTGPRTSEKKAAFFILLATSSNEYGIPNKPLLVMDDFTLLHLLLILLHLRLRCFKECAEQAVVNNQKKDSPFPSRYLGRISFVKLLS